MICERCKRPVQSKHNRNCTSGNPAAYVKVVHAYYGCDTGCCGHIAYVCDNIGNVIERGKFEFDHPNGYSTDFDDKKTYALDFAHQFLEIYNVPLNEMECEISYD